MRDHHKSIVPRVCSKSIVWRGAQFGHEATDVRDVGMIDADLPRSVSIFLRHPQLPSIALRGNRCAQAPRRCYCRASGKGVGNLCQPSGLVSVFKGAPCDLGRLESAFSTGEKSRPIYDDSFHFRPHWVPTRFPCGTSAPFLDSSFRGKT